MFSAAAHLTTAARAALQGGRNLGRISPVTRTADNAALPATTITGRAAGRVDDAAVAGQWNSPVEVLGRRVYQRDDLFDPNQVTIWRQNGETVTGTNLERMATGRAPLDANGDAIQLHHLTGTEVNVITGTRGSLAEISTPTHTRLDDVLHIPNGTRNPNFTGTRTPDNHPSNVERYTSFRRNTDGTTSTQGREFDTYRGNYWRNRAQNYTPPPPPEIPTGGGG